MRFWWVIAVASCTQRVLPPQQQLVLYVDTDGPLPAAPGKTLAPGEPAPLFDTMIVDVYPPNQDAPCVGCTRQFALDVDQLLGVRASFGIPIPVGVSGHRARIRLFPSHWAKDVAGEFQPHPRTTIDVMIALPAGVLDAIQTRTVVLHTDRVGRPAELVEGTDEYFEGRPKESVVGKWAPARVVDCPTDPLPDEACIPGGAFWMGNPRLSQWADVPRLVVLSPYFLQTSEVTVAQYRPFNDPTIVLATKKKGCTYTPLPEAYEDHPVVCLTRSAASSFCRARGAFLPTEAQFEYAASGMRGATFVWGDDDPSCEDAIWGRGAGVLSGYGSSAQCTPKYPASLARVGSDDRDKLDRNERSIVDLIGNASEWIGDEWNEQSGSCWTMSGVYRDPVCKTPPPAPQSCPQGCGLNYRGGNWASEAKLGAAAARYGPIWGSNTVAITIGFRCARPAQ